MSNGFRKFLPPPEKFPGIENDTIVTHTEKACRTRPMIVEGIYDSWNSLLKEPFRGISTDGTPIPGLFTPQHPPPLTNTVSIAKAFTSLLDSLTPSQRAQVHHPLTSPHRRSWSNPELYMHRLGLRLEALPQPIITSVHALLQQTLSPEGYAKALGAMNLNAYLGTLVHAPGVLNENSYNILLFGSPGADASSPFAWLLYGHHLCLSAFVWGAQIVVSPTFTGAEPTSIDSGPLAGTRILDVEERLGLEFMRALSVGERERACVCKGLRPPELPAERWNRADQRHLCGAFQDNRVVPYEGICVGGLGPEFAERVVRIVEQFVLYLPQAAREEKLREVRRYMGETWFTWIGGVGDEGDEGAFYYRVQSPVVLCEFDHHSGVFLTNEDPMRFHIHTVLRTPNGGDYGHALMKEMEKENGLESGSN